jgi:4-hydroxyphenylpyruvate dioxygenase
METWENPLKTDGFAFIEFAAQDKSKFDVNFTKMGFTLTGHAPKHDVSLYEQGQIKFFVNNASDENVHEFAKAHGDSAVAMGFYVEDPKGALQLAIKRGATEFTPPKSSVWHGMAAIQGIGGTAIYFVARDDAYLQRFSLIKRAGIGVGLSYIDHLTHNVNRGHMDYWAEFYSKIFGFRQVRYFDIDGKLTGLFSKAMTSPCGKIKIPLNESKDDKSQIEEFLRQFNGEGIQHIALISGDIYQTIPAMRQMGAKFLDTPNTYYELIDKRLPNHGEDITKLQKDKILVDGVTTPKRKLLLQIFTENVFGPVFFEIIQRKGDEGFGEGNFQALFDSIELDQLRRGVL